MPSIFNKTIGFLTVHQLLNAPLELPVGWLVRCVPMDSSEEFQGASCELARNEVKTFGS